MRTLNGLEGVDSGRIVIDDVEITDPKANMNKVRQDVGMVFQHFNLFQHKTALEICDEDSLRRRPAKSTAR